MVKSNNLFNAKDSVSPKAAILGAQESLQFWNNKTNADLDSSFDLDAFIPEDFDLDWDFLCLDPADPDTGASESGHLGLDSGRWDQCFSDYHFRKLKINIILQPKNT